MEATKEVHYRRVYSSLELAAEVGGLFEVIQWGGFLLHFLFDSKSYPLQFLKDVFFVDDQS